MQPPDLNTNNQQQLKTGEKGTENKTKAEASNIQEKNIGFI